MKLANLAEKAVDIYRQNPLMDGTLDLRRRGELKGIIGAIASQKHLHRTISSMRSEGYQENSPAIRVFLNRLEPIESLLKRYEVAYGQITKLPYLT